MEEQQHMQAIAGGDVRRVVGTSVTQINNFMHWFQAISANMNPEAQRKALAASRRAALSVFADAEDTIKMTQALGDVRNGKYSTEMVAVGSTP